MIPPTGPMDVTIEDLLRHEDWLTALARSLVSPAEADDLVQETWMRAIQSPPRDAATARHWLARVARRLALRGRRASERRRARETAAARAEALPSTGATIERLHAQREVTRLVIALAEPYRTTLLLRYHHGLAVAAIAERTGTSEANVRQRLKRALDELRAKLRDTHGEGWKALVTPLATAGAVVDAVVVEGASLVARNALLAVAGVAAAGTLAVALLVRDRDVGPREALATTSLAVAAPGMRETPAAEQRAALTRPSSREAVPAGPLRGRVLDARGRALAAPAVRVGGKTVACDAEGRFVLGAGAWREEWTRDHDRPAPLPEHGVCVDGDHVTLRAVVAEIEGHSELVLVAAKWLHLLVETHDEHGVPVRDVEIRHEPRVTALAGLAVRAQVRIAGIVGFDDFGESNFADDGPIAQPPSSVPARYPCDLPAAELELRITRLGHVPCILGLAADGQLRREPDLRLDSSGAAVRVASASAIPIAKHPPVWREGDVLHVTLVTLRPPSCRVVGRVVDGHGNPVPDALVGFQKNLATTSGLDGRFRLELDPAQVPSKAAPLFVAKAGLRTALVADIVDRLHAAKGEPVELELRLAGAPLAIRGRVVGEDGKPRRDVVLFPWFSEDLGGELGTPEDLALPADAPSLDLGLGARRAFARVDQDGRFELCGLLDRRYRLRVCTELSWLALTTAPIRAGSDGVEIVVQRSDCGVALAGRVCDPQGRPVPDVQVVFAWIKDQRAGGECGGMVERTRTDAEGRYRADALMREGRLLFRKDGWCERSFALAAAKDPFHVVLARACEFGLQGNLAGIVSLELRDAQDQLVPIRDGDQEPSRDRSELVLTPGGAATVAAFTSELATTLVVEREDGKTERHALRLTPGAANTIRL